MLYYRRRGGSQTPHQIAAGLHTFQRWQHSVLRQNHQLLSNKATLGSIKQIVHDWLFWFCNNLLNVVDF